MDPTGGELLALSVETAEIVRLFSNGVYYKGKDLVAELAVARGDTCGTTVT